MTKEEYNSLTDEEKVEYQAANKVIEKLIRNDIISDQIQSNYIKNKKLRDGTIKDIVTISYFDIMQQRYFVYVDAETLELLYVMGPHKYIEIKKFFLNNI